MLTLHLNQGAWTRPREPSAQGSKVGREERERLQAGSFERVDG